jgi:hypothetical protein
MFKSCVIDKTLGVNAGMPVETCGLFVSTGILPVPVRQTGCVVVTL